MLWYSVLLSKQTIPVLKKKKENNIDMNCDIIIKNHDTELDKIIKKYDLSLLQMNYKTNEKYYIQNETNYVYKLENINNVHFLSIIYS